MPRSQDRFLAIPQAALERATYPKHEKLDLVVESGVRVDEEAIRVGYSLMAGKGSARIAFQFRLAVPHVDTQLPTLERTMLVAFGQQHPPRTEPNHKLSRGDYEVVMFDRHQGERINGDIVFGQRGKPSLRISTDLSDSYSTEVVPAVGAFGYGGVQVYESLPVAFPERTVLVNTRAIDLANVGGVRVLIEGLDPHPRHSDLIRVSLGAAYEYAMHLRSTLDGEGGGSHRFTDITEFSGPFGRPTPNLLDILTPRLAAA